MLNFILEIFSNSCGKTNNILAEKQSFMFMLEEIKTLTLARAWSWSSSYILVCLCLCQTRNFYR